MADRTFDFRGSSLQDLMTPPTPPTPAELPLPAGVSGDPDAPRWSEEYKWNLDGGFKARLEAFVGANPYGMELLSGFRSEVHQQELVDKAKAEHGNDWRRWAAAPGKSNHNRGLAGDLHYHNDQAEQWARDNAHRFGLEFPMDWEPWHVEPLGLRTGGYVVAEDYDYTESYTSEPYGRANPALIQQGGVDRSIAMMNAAMAGPLPPPQAVQGEESVLDSPGSSQTHDQALETPGAASDPVIDPTMREEG